MRLWVWFLTLTLMSTLFFPNYYKTRSSVTKKKVDDKGKPIYAETRETQKEQAMPLLEALIPQETINLEYVTNTIKVFWSVPLDKDLEPYYAWLRKAETKKSQFWKELQIYDLIQLSKTGLEYNQPMLVASLYLWDASCNTFHLPCTIVTPTIFNMGEDFDHNYMDEDTIYFGERKATYTLYTAKHHNKTNEDVSDEDHIAFLALWMSRCIFCSRSLQVAKRYLATYTLDEGLVWAICFSLTSMNL